MPSPKASSPSRHSGLILSERLAHDAGKSNSIRSESPPPPSAVERAALDDLSALIDEPEGRRNPNTNQKIRLCVDDARRPLALSYSEWRAARKTVRRVIATHRLVDKGRRAAQEKARRKRKPWVERSIVWRDVPASTQELAAQYVDRLHPKVGRAKESWCSKLLLQTHFHNCIKDDPAEINEDILPDGASIDTPDLGISTPGPACRPQTLAVSIPREFPILR